MEIKYLLYKILTIAALVEIAYLILINLALSLPLTQTIINQHKPEKYTVNWEKAWSWYPFRVHARGISANGQSNSQQWEVSVPAASASISILPIIFKSIRISNVTAQDVEYFQRPRPKPDKDYTDLQKFFPPIRNRELEQTVPTPLPKKKGMAWKIVINDIHASGNHRLWLFNIQGVLSGDLQADVIFQAPRGPFSLENGMVDIKLDSLTLNDQQASTKNGHIKGKLGISPFVPSENKGAKALGFININADIAGEVESLQFLDFYLSRLYGMSVDGEGILKGHLHFKEGILLPQTSLVISARKLLLNMLSFKAEGKGDINITVKPDTPDVSHLGIVFEDIEVVHEGDKIPHFTGEGVEINTRSTSTLIPLEQLAAGTGHVAIDIRNAQVPDLSVYQRYIPAEKAITLHGGQGTLQGQAELTPTSLFTSVDLSSNDADLSFQDYRFNTDLAVGVYADIPSLASGRVDISGTFLRLDNSRLAHKEKDQKSQNWETALTLTKGIIDLPLPDTKNGEDDAKSLSNALKDTDLRTLLQTSDGQFKINGSVSDLAWVNLLLTNSYNLSVGGSGKILADMHIKSGLPSSGSMLDITSPQLEIDILDYVATGDGQVLMKVSKGGERPNLEIALEIEDALLKRSGEMDSFIKDVELKLLAKGESMAFDKSDRLSDLHLQILSAKVTDMSIYDEYLPDKVPILISGGEADLQADIYLQPNSADGYVKLKTDGLQIQWNDQEISADFTADINLAGGQPREMIFDISGSRLLLDKVRVAGQENDFEDEDWTAQFILSTGKAEWRKPVSVEAVADLDISDSRPVIAIFSNEKDSPAWLEKMLTTENIQGNVEMTLENRQLTIPHALVNSDKIDIGAKGIMTDQIVEGIIYARYKKLDAVLNIENDKKKLGILRAKKKFDEYSPSQPKQESLDNEDEVDETQVNP